MLPAQMLGGPRVLARLKRGPEYLRADASVYFWVLPFTPEGGGEASASLQVGSDMTGAPLSTGGDGGG